MTKHETMRIVSGNARIVERVTGTYHLNQLLRVHITDLKKM
jgi:hypothetical protein